MQTINVYFLTARRNGLNFFFFFRKLNFRKSEREDKFSGDHSEEKMQNIHY